MTGDQQRTTKSSDPYVCEDTSALDTHSQGQYQFVNMTGGRCDTSRANARLLRILSLPGVYASIGTLACWVWLVVRPFIDGRPFVLLFHLSVCPYQHHDLVDVKINTGPLAQELSRTTFQTGNSCYAERNEPNHARTSMRPPGVTCSWVYRT